MSRKWYGSFQNRLGENSVSPDPVVGMGATEFGYSDRHAYDVISIHDDRHIDVRRLDCKIKDGTDWLDQKYEYKSDENGIVLHLFKKKGGQWVSRHGRTEVSRFALGHACEYMDPSF